MSLLPSRNPTENEPARQNIVPAVRERFFQRYKRKIHLICEEVEAEEQGWEVCRQEDVDKMGEWVVVSGGEGVWCRERMVPGRVERGEWGRRGVQHIAVKGVSKDL